MAKNRLRWVAVCFIGSIVTCDFATAADQPNRATPSDVAAGRWVDSLLGGDLNAQPQARASQPGPPRVAASRRSNLRGKLVRNANTRDGSPPFALVDRYGGILRYVEPVKSVDLAAYLGKEVSVRHDTGDILLASQLAIPRTGSNSAASGVRLAQHEEPTPAEPIPAGEPESILTGDPEPIPTGEEIDEPIYLGEEVIENGPIYIDEGYDGLDFGGCPNCGSYVCRQFGGCGSRGRAYVRGEYLLWWFDGMDTPPLVTQSDPVDGGVLPNPGIPGDNPSTVILFGGENLLNDPRSGGRVIFGVWLDNEGRQALEFDYLRFGEESLTFSAAGEDGNPTISRPFFDLFPDDDDDGIIDIPPSEAAEQVSSAILDGRVTVRIVSDFESFGVRFRHNLCCKGGCSTGCGDCVGCGSGIGCGSGVGWGSGTRRIDLLTGFRYAKLEESLHVREDLVVDAGDAGTLPPGLIIPPDGTQFLVQDLFETENEFVGGEVGFLWEIERQRWTFELLSKLAIGNTRQRARIDGSTAVTTDPPTVPAPDPSVGGLLAQSSNIGSYERDQFSVMPEIGLTLGYRLTPRLRLTAGYTLLYWTNVLRPGDQIDREINGTLIPDFDANGDPVPPGALVGPLRPAFTFENTNIWAQGLNVGGELRW